MVCLDMKEKIGQHIPMNCLKIGHSYKAFTYLFGQNTFIRLSFIRHSRLTKNSSVDLMKLAVMSWANSD